MNRLVARVRKSLPSRKPQLWEALGFCARRKAVFVARTLSDEEWVDRAQVVRLREHGLVMEIVPRGVIGRHLYLYGVWEIVGTRLFNVLLDPGMRFVDIGANIGYYTLLAARLVGHSGRVYSFEPHAESRDRLERNIQMNRLDNIQVRCEAVARQSGSVDFFPVSQRDNEGQSSMLRGEGTQQTPVTVPSISLDDFVSQLPEHRVDVLKIDVEGAESEVFAGAHTVLSGPSAPRAILYESTAVLDKCELLESYGYASMGVYYSLGQGLQFIDPRQQDTIHALLHTFEGQPTLDYLAIKKDGRGPAAFDELAQRSRSAIPRALRVLGTYC